MSRQKLYDHHETIPSTLADLLKDRRKTAGLTQAAMAAELGISRAQILRLESGQNKHPSPVLLGRMSKYLNVKPEDLYALTGCMPPTDLPGFVPYLRAVHPDWPDSAIAGLDEIHDFLDHKYSSH